MPLKEKFSSIKMFSLMSPKSIQNRKSVPLFLALILLICFPVFYKLNRVPLITWDESLFALRAWYMLKTGDYMYNFNLFPGLVDHQNTKLPFTTFFQVIGMKVFGLNEWGVRLPIAFIFLGASAYVISFFRKFYQSTLSGFMFPLILVASSGFVARHLLRTGDQDVPFACYLLLATLFFFLFTEYGKSKYLTAFTLCFLAALFTKNLLAGIIGPGLLVYILVQKKLKLLKDYRVYVALAVITGLYLVAVFYFEQQYPGFIKRMWEYELSGRYSENIEGHRGGFTYYFELLKTGFSPFVWVALSSLVFVFDRKISPFSRNLIQVLVFVFFSYALILSFSSTKTTWYHAPLYPLAAMLTAVTLHHIYMNYFVDNKASFRRAGLCIALIFYGFAYGKVVEHVSKPASGDNFEKYGRFISHMAAVRPEIKKFTIVDRDFSTAAYFFAEKYNHEDDSYQISYIRHPEIKEGDVIMSCHKSVLSELWLNFELQLEAEYEICRTVTVLGESVSKEE